MRKTDTVDQVITLLSDQDAMALLTMWLLKIAKEHRDEQAAYDDPLHLGHAISELLTKYGFKRHG